MKSAERAARLAAGLLVAGAAFGDNLTLPEAPPLEEFCLEAQRVIVQTAVRPRLVVQPDFDSFVKSKAAIAPLTIQQFVWYAPEEPTHPLMVSCKLKSADHLNQVFGPGTAGGNGLCQDMNRLTYQRLLAAWGAVGVPDIQFDPMENIQNKDNPGMTGPDWLKPYQMTYRDEEATLHLRSKGFRVDWTDPQFGGLPERFRGVQYCHLIAPDYLARLLTDQAPAGLSVGREVTDLSRAQPMPAQ